MGEVLLYPARHEGCVLEQIVASNDKKRFAFSPDGARIRASQGHSIDIDLELSPLEPPELLFHGTATRFLESIDFPRETDAAKPT